jgi:hypothetical protein
MVVIRCVVYSRELRYNLQYYMRQGVPAVLRVPAISTAYGRSLIRVVVRVPVL